MKKCRKNKRQKQIFFLQLTPELISDARREINYFYTIEKKRKYVRATELLRLEELGYTIDEIDRIVPLEEGIFRKSRVHYHSIKNADFRLKKMKHPVASWADYDQGLIRGFKDGVAWALQEYKKLLYEKSNQDIKTR